jgi:hypothetical protein
MSARNQKKLQRDLERVRQIDEADVDLPYGESDFIEECLVRLNEGKALTEQARGRLRALLEYVRLHSSSPIEDTL